MGKYPKKQTQRNRPYTDEELAYLAAMSQQEQAQAMQQQGANPISGIAGIGGQTLGMGLGSKLGGGLFGSVTPSVSASGATATTGTAGASALPAAASVVPIAGAAVGAGLLGKGAYDLAKGKKGDSISRTQLAFTTGGLSELARPFFGGGKGKDQIKRDQVRKQLQSTGFIDKDFNIDFGGDNKFDIGKDGRSYAYNVDFSKEEAGQTVGDVNPLAVILGQGDKKIQTDFAGYFANAAMNKGDPRANARKLYEKAGVDLNTGLTAIGQLQDAGKISEPEAAAYRNGLVNLLSDNKKRK